MCTTQTSGEAQPWESHCAGHEEEQEEGREAMFKAQPQPSYGESCYGDPPQICWLMRARQSAAAHTHTLWHTDTLATPSTPADGAALQHCVSRWDAGQWASSPHTHLWAGANQSLSLAAALWFQPIRALSFQMCGKNKPISNQSEIWTKWKGPFIEKEKKKSVQNVLLRIWIWLQPERWCWILFSCGSWLAIKRVYFK